MVGERIQGRVSAAMTNSRALVDGLLGRVREGSGSLVELASQSAQNFATANRALIR